MVECKIICCGPKRPRFDKDGAHCPECDELMEIDSGPMGNPAWFHKRNPITKKESMGR